MLSKKRGSSPFLTENGKPLNVASTSEELIRNVSGQVDNELKELHTLNDKLKSYIDQVSSLEKENRQLEALITRRKNQCISADPSIAKRTNDLWEQLNQVRNQLDEEVKLLNESEQNLKTDILEIENITMKLSETRKEIYTDKAKLTELEFENEAKLDEIQRLEDRIAYSQARLDKLEEEKNVYEDSIFKANQQLASENNERIRLLNTIQTIEEEIRFYNALHEITQSEMCKLKLYPSVEEVRTHRNNQYQLMGSIRREFEELAKRQIADLERYYGIKTDEMKKELKNEMRNETKNTAYATSMNSNGNVLSRNLDPRFKYQENSGRAQAFLNKIEKLKNEYTGLQNEHKQLEHFIIQQQELHKNESNARYKVESKIDMEIAEVSKQIKRKYQELNRIMENHVNLNFEICAFRSLLGKDIKSVATPTIKVQQLKVTQLPKVSSRLSKIIEDNKKSIKQFESDRNANLEQNDDRSQSIPNEVNNQDFKFESIGDRLIHNTFIDSICISDIDPSGEYILLLNYGSASVNLKDWTITRHVKGSKAIIWTINSDNVLQPFGKLKIFGKSLTTTDSDAISADLENGWTFGNNVVTTLKDTENIEQAAYTEDKAH
ncbi:hypothetical protein GJ496_004197 [Pomphorhynchus laevis]|nr:hypothetical protein GJ496_004197 [Pomphorhynchus laevis]